MVRLSFEQWQATRKPATQAELAEFASVDTSNISVSGGFIYSGACWIETLEGVGYAALIANTQFVDADLAKVERHLYDNWFSSNAEADGLDAITEAMIAEAAQNPDLDAALVPMMKAAGIEDGGIAGVAFSAFDVLGAQGVENRWADASAAVRTAAIRAWIETERLYADTDDGED